MGTSASVPLNHNKNGDDNWIDRKRRNQKSASTQFFTSNVAQCDAPPAPPPLPDARSSGPTPPPPSAGSPPPPPPEEDDSIAKAAATASAYSNPGPYDQMSGDTKRLVMLDTFDGFKCDINKQVSPFMLAMHSFHMGTTTHAPPQTNPQVPPPNSTYYFITQVADEAGILMTRVDPQRQGFDGRLQRMFGPGMIKGQANMSADGQTDQLLLEYDIGGQTWTGNLKYGSMGGGLMYGVNYWQAITPKLSLGGEGMFLAANNATLSSYGFKYSFQAPISEATDLANRSPTGASPAHPGMPPPSPAGASSICLQYNTGQQALTASYQRVVTPNRVTVGAELQCSPFTLDSQVVVAAEFQLLRSKINLAADGEGRIQGLLETKLGRGPQVPRLTFSADLDHFKSQMKFGYGISIDSS